MAYIRDYWADKGNMAKQAEAHTAHMAKHFYDEISFSAYNTKVYDTDFRCGKDAPEKRTEAVFLAMDTVSAASAVKDSKKMAILNFASYKNPGGAFLDGSKAQEHRGMHHVHPASRHQRHPQRGIPLAH